LATSGNTFTGTLAADYLRLALAAYSGRLEHRPVLGDAARGALLIDLVASGALVRTAEGTELDTTPTGVLLIDKMLHAVVKHPNHTMERRLRRGSPHLDECLAQLVAEGTWTTTGSKPSRRRGGYLDADEPRFRSQLRQLFAIYDGRTAPTGPRSASLAALGGVTGLLGPTPYVLWPPAEVLEACAELSWIVRDITHYLYAAQVENEVAGATNTATMFTQGI
jgi:hypothetical protein